MGTMRVLCFVLMTMVACRFDPAGVADDVASDAAVIVDADPCTAAEVEAEGAHTCARRGDGSVVCWGNNERGELGAPSPGTCEISGAACSLVPTPVEELPPAGGLGLGDSHTCALTFDRRTFCWGDNSAGQFGGGDAEMQPIPIAVEGRHGAVELVGGETYSCARDGGDAIWCSGLNARGELGIGSTTPSPEPVEIPGVTASALAGGYQGMCAIRAADGQVLCWGSNDLGQLDATSVGQDVLSPIGIAGVTGATRIAAGLRHGCAVVGGGGGMCWGDNGDGQLGTGSAGSPQDAVTIGVPAPIDAIATGVNHTCVLRDGVVMCWGEGWGPIPVTIELPGAPDAITAGSYHGCALLPDAGVWCWGSNAYGQLGDGTTESSYTRAVQARLCER